MNGAALGIALDAKKRAESAITQEDILGAGGDSVARQGLKIWRFSPELYRNVGDITDGPALLRAVQAANGAPVVCNDRYDVRDLQFGDLPVNIVGTGTLLHSAGASVISISRTPGPAIAVTTAPGPTTYRTFAASTTDGNAWSATPLTVVNASTFRMGDVYSLSSQDAYPWSQDAWPNATNPKVFQNNLIEISGIGLDYAGGISATPFAEGELVIGQSSGAQGVVRSTSLAAAGILVFASTVGNFVSGEGLIVEGTVRALSSTAPVVLTAERLEYNFITSPVLRKMPTTKCSIAVAIEAIGDIDSRVGSVNRKQAILLEGVYQPDLDISVRSAWTRAILRRSCYKGRVRAHIMRLPNDADTTESAYGYGVELAGADYGAEVVVSGGNCRHMFTTNTYLTSAYQNISIWQHGTVKNTVVRGSGSNCFNAAFDTHAGAIRISFLGCAVSFATHVGRSISGSIGFQNRSYATKYEGCICTGGTIGFVEQSLGQSAGFTYVNEWISCVADEYRLAGFLNSSSSSKNQGRLSYRNITARGDGVAPTILVQNGLHSQNAARIKVDGALFERFNNTPMRFNGGDIILDNILYDCTQLGTTQVSGIRFDAASSICLGRITVVPGTATAQPTSVIRWVNPSNITIVKFGKISSASTLIVPLLQNSSTGIATVTDAPESTGTAI